MNYTRPLPLGLSQANVQDSHEQLILMTCDSCFWTGVRNFFVPRAIWVSVTTCACHAKLSASKLACNRFIKIWVFTCGCLGRARTNDFEGWTLPTPAWICREYSNSEKKSQRTSQRKWHLNYKSSRMNVTSPNRLDKESIFKLKTGLDEITNTWKNLKNFVVESWGVHSSRRQNWTCQLGWIMGRGSLVFHSQKCSSFRG